ncbi:flagellar basal body protein [Rhizobium sp. FY34]|uniref:flagellar basal body protein n=1 Tax=Rhizobium sp. FY34 TaxID=2562309 RepID=UPI0010C10A3E|nr:flagellar basal body protein [Rhizobium sp. FY34]
MLNAVANTALSGMQAQITRVSATANNIANINSSGYAPLSTQFQTTANGGVTASVEASSTPTQPDPLDDMTGLIESELAFKANASVFETGADLWDVLASIKKD